MIKLLLCLFVPYVISIYSIVLVYCLNKDIVSVWLFVFAILLMLIFSSIVFFIFKFISKDDEKSSLLTSFIVILFYQWGWYVFFCKEWLFAFILILNFVLLLIKFDCKKLFKIAFAFALILTLMSFFNVFKTVFKTVYRKYLISQKQELRVKKNTLSVPDKDIYIILLDSYPANDVLKRDLSFDNNKFINLLKSRDFYVYDSIYSNYQKTIASVPSFMNLSYIEDLYLYSSSSQAISNSVFIKNAYKSGYKNYYINSFSTFNIKGDYIDKIVDISGQMFYSWHGMLLLFFGNTLYADMYNFPFVLINKDNRSFWEIAADITKDSSSKFVFAHILAPHFPYLKNKYGEDFLGSENTDDIIVNSKDMEYRINKKSCVEYIQYINNRTLALVDKILKESKGNAYIVIMGDHGLRLHYYYNNDNKHFDSLKKEKASINSTFNTFLAFYSPDKNYKNYHDKECLINFFRAFSNDVFKTNYKPLKCEYRYIYQSTHDENFSVIYKNMVKMKKSEIEY